jgi:hypothetical protein
MVLVNYCLLAPSRGVPEYEPSCPALTSLRRMGREAWKGRPRANVATHIAGATVTSRASISIRKDRAEPERR